MKKLKIDSLDKLEAFINNEIISLEDRLTVFTKAIDQYPLFIISVKFDDDSKIIENRSEVLEQMKRLLKELKADPNQATYSGFWVAYENK